MPLNLHQNSPLLSQPAKDFVVDLLRPFYEAKETMPGAKMGLTYPFSLGQHRAAELVVRRFESEPGNKHVALMRQQLGGKDARSIELAMALPWGEDHARLEVRSRMRPVVRLLGDALEGKGLWKFQKKNVRAALRGLAELARDLQTENANRGSRSGLFNKEAATSEAIQALMHPVSGEIGRAVVSVAKAANELFEQTLGRKDQTERRSQLNAAVSELTQAIEEVVRPDFDLESHKRAEWEDTPAARSYVSSLQMMKGLENDEVNMIGSILNDLPRAQREELGLSCVTPEQLIEAMQPEFQELRQLTENVLCSTRLGREWNAEISQSGPIQ